MPNIPPLRMNRSGDSSGIWCFSSALGSASEDPIAEARRFKQHNERITAPLRNSNLGFGPQLKKNIGIGVVNVVLWSRWVLGRRAPFFTPPHPFLPLIEIAPPLPASFSVISHARVSVTLNFTPSIPNTLLLSTVCTLARLGCVLSFFFCPH